MRIKLILWLTAVITASGEDIVRDDHFITDVKVAPVASVNDINFSSDQNHIHEKITVNRGNKDASYEKGRETDTTNVVNTNEKLNIVETTYGPVEGLQLNSGVTAYYDVPYGKINSHFQAPSEPNVWTEIHQATEHKTSCPQLNLTDDNEVIGDLDCLTLSIFTPESANRASVLLYIHGGELKTGSGNSTVYGPEHLVSQGVILILPNYRLGPLGFLCVENLAPGNAALKDLTLALRWTVNNIAAFGGDPSNIVVSGDGLSSALAGYLALSPLSSDYVSKVITESGSVLSQKTIDRDPIGTALKLASALNRHDAINDISDIGGAELKDLIISSKDIQFRPCIETSSNSFLNETIWNILHETEVKKPFLIGAANYAGLHEYLELTAESLKEINEDNRHLLPEDICFTQESERTDAANKIKKLYFEYNDISLNEIEELTLLFTDTLYLGPAIRSARALLNAGAKVYFYEFSFNGSLNRESANIEVELVGAARGDIVGYLFAYDGALPTDDPKEKVMVDLMTDLWVSFIKTGQPSSGRINWDELKISEENNEEWLSIGSKVSLEKGVHVKRLAMWNQLYDNYFVDKSSGMVLIPKQSLLAVAVISLLSASIAGSTVY